MTPPTEHAPASLRRRAFTGAAAAVLALTLAAPLLAQAQAQPADATPPVAEAANAAETGTATALPTLIDLFMFSPIINGVLLGLSALALMLFLFFLLTINHRAMVPGGFMEEVTKLVVRQKHEQAGDLCRSYRRVFVATILQRLCENSEKDPAVLMDILDTEGRRRSDVMWNRISYLADISNIAPMVGLLGTVIGMIKAFFALNLADTSVANTPLAQGIGEAMATTMFGLAVAILATVFYSLVKSRATRVLADAEQAVHTVADLIKRESNPPPAPAAPGARRPTRRPPPAPGVPRSTTTRPGRKPGGDA